MTVCLYLPDGSVGFMFQRPEITSNDTLSAGGLEITVIEPFRHLRVRYRGELVLLRDPSQMADPRQAFRHNPRHACEVDLDFFGISPMWGGRRSESELTAQALGTAHYEQHTRSTGTISFGPHRFEVRGLGLRDKSWGPRYWQSMPWYRWLTMTFDETFAMMLLVQGFGEDGSDIRPRGIVLSDGIYRSVTECRIDSTWDDALQVQAIHCHATTEDGERFEVTGEIVSMIPLRNRRTTPGRNELTTRITEAMTRYRYRDKVTLGMSEYLDQMVGGRPVGLDIPAASTPTAEPD
jgi:hypothetical protein